MKFIFNFFYIFSTNVNCLAQSQPEQFVINDRYSSFVLWRDYQYIIINSETIPKKKKHSFIKKKKKKIQMPLELD